MTKTIESINSSISIAQFDKGQTSRIFDRLRKESQLIVLKKDEPVAVILSPTEYARFCEVEDNYELLLEAKERLNKTPAYTTSREGVMIELGISEEELTNAKELIIE